MDRNEYYQLMDTPNGLDYECYLNTEALLSCQKPFDQLCNRDELQFQIVHQVEELWMKLMIYTLLDIDEYMAKQDTNRVLTLFQRVHQLQRQMTDQLHLLETMSPKEYQQIRLELGNGSGQESPGFRTLLTMPQHLWQTYSSAYLEKEGVTVAYIYDEGYRHCDAYMVAEALAEFDELFQTFRFHHMQLIKRSIGIGSSSLKGRPVEQLGLGVRHQFFPELWEVRSAMTDKWGSSYGKVRPSIGQTNES